MEDPAKTLISITTNSRTASDFKNLVSTLLLGCASAFKSSACRFVMRAICNPRVSDELTVIHIMESKSCPIISI